MSSTGSIPLASGRLAKAMQDARPDALFYSAVLLSWAAVWRIQDLFPILAAVQFPMLIQLTTLGLFLSDRNPIRRIENVKSPILTILVVFFSIMLIGIPTSLWINKSIEFVIKEFLPTALLMIIVATMVREKKDLERFAFSVLCGAVIYATVIFLFYPVGPDGRLADLVYYDANDFGLLLVCSIPFAVYFLRPGVVTWKRLFALGALLLLVIMMIRTGSRGAFLGFIAVMGYILIRYRALPARLRIGSAIAGVALLVGVGSTAYFGMMKTLLDPKDDYNMTDDVGRKKVWLRGIGYMATHPIIGVGVRAFPQAEGMLSDIAKRYAERGKGLKWSVAHNSFIEIGAECGIIALGLFISLFIVSVRTLATVRPTGRGSPEVTIEDMAYSQMLIASFIGYAICGFFISAQYFSYFYLLLALTIGQQAILRRRRLNRQHPMAPSQITPVQQKSLKLRPIRTHWLPAGR